MGRSSLTPIERRAALRGQLQYYGRRGLSRDVAVDLVAFENAMTVDEVARVAGGMRWEVRGNGAS